MSVLLGTGCDPSDSVCPTCPGSTGGESSDFGGTPHPCSLFERRVASDADTAAALGFDVMTLVARIEREVDAPLYWQTTRGDRARGYNRLTGIQMNARVLGFTHFVLDPQSCNGTTCRHPGDAAEYICSDRLEVDVEADVQTVDGAIGVTMRGYALHGRKGFPFHEIPSGTLRVDLDAVNGTLELPEPSQSLRSAELRVDFYVHAERTDGDIKTAWILGNGREEQPLWGTWPEPVVPAGAPDSAARIDDP